MKNARRIFRVLAVIYTIAIALFIGGQAIDLYRDAYRPEMLSEFGTPIEPAYTPEKVAGRIRASLVFSAGYPVIILCALALGRDDKRRKRSGNSEYALMRLTKNAGALCDGAAREEKYRKRLKAVRICAVLVCMLPTAIYLLDGSHFSTWETTPAVRDMALYVLPWLIAAFAAEYLCAWLHDRSVGREIDILRADGVKRAGCADIQKGKGRNALRAALFLAAAAGIALGASNGDANSVLAKAIRICTECIGLG